MPDDQDYSYEDSHDPQTAQALRNLNLWARCRPPDGGEVPYGPGDLPPEVIHLPTEPGQVVKAYVGWYSPDESSEGRP